MRDERCACGSTEVEIWKRPRMGGSPRGPWTYFCECMKCGAKADGKGRRAATDALRSLVVAHSIQEWSEDE